MHKLYIYIHLCHITLITLHYFVTNHTGLLYIQIYIMSGDYLPYIGAHDEFAKATRHDPPDHRRSEVAIICPSVD